MDYPPSEADYAFVNAMDAKQSVERLAQENFDLKKDIKRLEKLVEECFHMQRATMALMFKPESIVYSMKGSRDRGTPV